MEQLVNSLEDTYTLAQKTALQLKQGDVVLLHGTLGMGRTEFARAMIRSLCDYQTLEVPSPTFTLVQTYKASIGEIYHFDLYRLKDPDEIYELGWEEALSEGITIVDWPERLGPYKPARTLDITLSSVENNPNARKILIDEK